MSKLSLVVVLLVVIVIAALVPGMASADGGPVALSSQTGTVSAGSSFARVRSGPGTQYGTVGQLRTGEVVTILETVQGQAVYRGQPLWYRIGEGRYIYSALVTVKSGTAAPTPQPQPAPAPGKWIEVILSEHKLIAWDGNGAALTTIVAIGKPSTPTVKGTFRVYAKYRSINMSGAGYYQPRVPHTMFFYGGYAIHGAYWHKKFGQSVSHGCVNLNLTDAAWLYDWTPVGTTVVVHN